MLGRLLFVLFAIFCRAKSSCPDGSLEWNSNCYIFNGTLQGFAKAEVACLEIGGYLTSIHDIFTDAKIARTAQESFLQSSEFWIGANNLKTPNQWEWIDGSKFDFEEWAKGEPTDSNLNGLNCGAVSVNDGYWKAADCLQSKPFVCSIPNISTPSSTPPPPPPSTTTIFSNCSEGWDYFEFTNSCYLYIYHQRFNWQNTETFCQSMGAHSASIHSHEELKFVSNYYLEHCESFWLGLHSLDDGFTWQWSDNSPFDYAPWEYPPQSLGNKNCATFDVGDCTVNSEFFFDADVCIENWRTLCKKSS